MKILVTGISGFVGQHLERVLHAAGYAVSGLVRQGGHVGSDDTQIHWVDDICSCDFSAVTAGVDVVVHLAALVHQPHIVDSDRYLSINTDATVALATAALRNNVSRFISLSTSHVYEGARGPHSETLAPNPRTPYASSKYKASQALARLYEGSSSFYYIVRPPLIYGEGVKGNMRSLAALIDRVAMTPFKNATGLRSYLSVANLCSFVLHLIQHPVASGVYNLSDNHDLSTQQLCECLARAQGKSLYQFSLPKPLMKWLFSLLRRPDHFEKLYGAFQLNIEKALATGWAPAAIADSDFKL